MMRGISKSMIKGSDNDDECLKLESIGSDN
jgi:hypothetical protein